MEVVKDRIDEGVSATVSMLGGDNHPSSRPSQALKGGKYPISSKGDTCVVVPSSRVSAKSVCRLPVFTYR